MNAEQVREFCLSLPRTTEDLPFDESTLAFRVGQKIFALTDANTFKSLNLKCDPEKAIELREHYPKLITPGYHMNKKNWNTVWLNADLPVALIKDLIEHSYQLVLQSLPKSVRSQIS